MTVKELIKILALMPPEAKVVRNYGGDGYWKEVGDVSLRHFNRKRENGTLATEW